MATNAREDRQALNDIVRMKQEISELYDKNPQLYGDHVINLMDQVRIKQGAYGISDEDVKRAVSIDKSARSEVLDNDSVPAAEESQLEEGVASERIRPELTNRKPLNSQSGAPEFANSEAPVSVQELNTTKPVGVRSASNAISQPDRKSVIDDLLQMSSQIDADKQQARESGITRVNNLENNYKQLKAEHNISSLELSEAALTHELAWNTCRTQSETGAELQELTERAASIRAELSSDPYNRDVDGIQSAVNERVEALLDQGTIKMALGEDVEKLMADSIGKASVEKTVAPSIPTPSEEGITDKVEAVSDQVVSSGQSVSENDVAEVGAENRELESDLTQGEEQNVEAPPPPSMFERISNSVSSIANNVSSYVSSYFQKGEVPVADLASPQEVMDPIHEEPQQQEQAQSKLPEKALDALKAEGTALCPKSEAGASQSANAVSGVNQGQVAGACR